MKWGPNWTFHFKRYSYTHGKSFTHSLLTHGSSLYLMYLSGVKSKVLPNQGASPPNQPSRLVHLLWDLWVAHGEASCRG
jgi:hypothetical protein